VAQHLNVEHEIEPEYGEQETRTAGDEGLHQGPT
jgi:hypothetical protein